MKTVTSSSQENTRKISKQFLFFGVILVRSPCHYYDVKKNQLCFYQRWSPRGHILKSLALASRPQVLENWPVLGSRTAVFFELLKFCEALEKFFG